MLIVFSELKCKKGERSVNEFIELEKRCREVGLVMETYLWWQIVPRWLCVNATVVAQPPSTTS